VLGVNLERCIVDRTSVGFWVCFFPVVPSTFGANSGMGGNLWADGNDCVVGYEDVGP